MKIEIYKHKQNPLMTDVNGLDKNTKYRLKKFDRWLQETKLEWHQAGLGNYRDWLLSLGHKASGVSSLLSTVRKRYKELARDRDMLYRIAEKQTDNLLERKALVDELVERIRNIAHPDESRVKSQVSQDTADSEHLRLTRPQAEALMEAPGVDTLQGIRNTAIISLILCTGAREAEASSLEVKDLRQRMGGELALHIRKGKGCKERLVPYGNLNWVLAITDLLLRRAWIEKGYVFKGYYKGWAKERPGHLSIRSIEYIVKQYPIMIDGKLTKVRPHDLRRTYARRLYETGMDIVAIQQNLGHSDIKTTLGYIGSLDAAQRRAKSIYSFDLSKLHKKGIV